MRSLLFSLLALGACAEAGKSGIEGHPDGGGNHPDASGQHIDAFVNTIDAPPGMTTKTLDENGSDTLMAASSIACGKTDGSQTQANSYYRVYDPHAFGINTDFHITQVSFQIEDCESAQGNGQIVTVQVGTYNGTPSGNALVPGDLAMIAQNTTVQVPEVDETGAGTNGGTVNASITATIPAGKLLYAEVDGAAGNVGSFLYIGSNNGTETAPSYFSAASCTNPGATPKTMASVKGSAASILMTVTGTY